MRPAQIVRVYGFVSRRADAVLVARRQGARLRDRSSVESSKRLANTPPEMTMIYTRKQLRRHDVAIARLERTIVRQRRFRTRFGWQKRLAEFSVVP